MEKIRSEQEYRSAVSLAKARGYRLSNCFFLPADIRKKTAEGTLSFQSLDDGLLLLDQAGTFYRCYYFLPESFVPRPLKLDRDAVIEFPFSGAMNELQLAQVRMISGMGFHLGRESGMMSVSPEAVVFFSEGQPEDPRAGLAEEGDIPQILDLLNRCFDPLYAFLPDEEELQAAVRNGQVLVVREKPRRIAAALYSGRERNTAVIRQIAVEPLRRGNGLAGCLLDGYHRMYRKEVSLFRHWVDLRNSPAVSMYRKAGYAFTLRKANEYVLRKEDHHDEGTIA